MIRPRDILQVADALSAGDSEAEWRSAISRAYYALFHTARLLLQQCGFEVPHADPAHSYLWLRLSNADHPDVVNAGRIANHQRQLRNWADYDLERPVRQSPTMGYVAQADDVMHLLESVAAEPAVCARIAEAMKKYERDVLRQVTWHA